MSTTATSSYNFKKIAVVPTAKDFIDIVLSKTQRKTPTVIHPSYAISRIRSFYMRKVSARGRAILYNGCLFFKEYSFRLINGECTSTSSFSPSSGQIHAAELSRQDDDDNHRVPQARGHPSLLRGSNECSLWQRPLQTGSWPNQHRQVSRGSLSQWYLGRAFLFPTSLFLMSLFLNDISVTFLFVNYMSLFVNYISVACHLILISGLLPFAFPFFSGLNPRIYVYRQTRQLP